MREQFHWCSNRGGERAETNFRLILWAQETIQTSGLNPHQMVEIEKLLKLKGGKDFCYDPIKMDVR